MSPSSTDTPGGVASTSSPVASPARTSASPARERASTASAAVSSLSCCESFAKYDPSGSSWRTSQRSLLGDLIEYSGRWPNSGSMRSGACYRQPTPVLPTCESGGGAWLGTPMFPTPLVGDAHLSSSPDAAKRRLAEGKATLSRVAALFPTPRAGKTTDEDEASWRARQERGDVATPPLALAVRMIPTPTVGDSKSSARANYTEGAMHHGVTLTDYARQTPVPGQLNADWVELLMGWPDGWTVLPPGTGPATGRRSRGSPKDKPTASLDSAP